MRVRHNADISAFAGRLAHELSNIQNGITGYLSLLEDYADTDEAGRQTYDDTQKAVARTATLITRLKAVAGRQQMHIRPVHLPLQTAAVAAEIRPALPPGIRLRLHLGRGVDEMTLDDEKYRLALKEMIANAAEAMKGTGTVHIELSVVDGAGTGGADYIRIAVGDTGPGMPPAQVGIAGTPLQTTKSYPHKGWGLAICEGFTRQAGGFLDMETREGLGTCAALMLPRQAREA